MTREDINDIIKAICPNDDDYEKPIISPAYLKIELEALALDQVSNSENQSKWIPVKWHEITDEEREREGYPEDYLTKLDCPMPNDGEEILVTIKSSRGSLHVEKDACCLDDGYSLDSGYDWTDDVVAWMPLPQPYKAESEDKK